MTKDKPPPTLSNESREIWRKVNKSFDLEYEKLLILKTSLEQYDLYTKAREVVAREGFSVPTSQGIKTHPAVGAMKTARDGFLAAWRMMGIGVETNDVGRPTDKLELQWAKRLHLA